MTEQFYKTKTFNDFRVLNPKELNELREYLLKNQRIYHLHLIQINIYIQYYSYKVTYIDIIAN